MSQELTVLIQHSLIEELEELRDGIQTLVQPLSDKELWCKPLEPGNSIGHLILHLTGNLNHFVGAQLGGTGYQREREREFTETQPPSRLEVLANLDAAVALFRQVVGKLNAEQLAAPHPHAKFGTVLKALIHLVAHFAVHRGQMTYLARLCSSTSHL
jgi:uncharacterized damage-inducible protein DinB